MTLTPYIKTCTQCARALDIGLFSRNKATKDGRLSRCKDCCHAAAKVYRDTNKGKVRDQYKRWAESRPDYIKGRNKSYRASNRGYFLTKHRAYYCDNTESEKARKKAWRKANPHRCHFHSRLHQVRKRAATVGDTKLILEWENGWRSQTEVKCNWCGGLFHPTACHSDHIMPLSKGGSHCVENLCISCATCNLKKKDALPEDWKARMFYV